MTNFIRDNKMYHFIQCYDKYSRQLKWFQVSESVSIYIKQLECEIKYKTGGIQKLYPTRFEKNCFCGEA